MEAVEQESFEPVPGLDTAFEPRLVLHRRTNPTRNETLVVFVHGFIGRRYSTWKKFPALIYDDFEQVDVACYRYRTGLARLKAWRSIDIEEEARVLAGSLKTLEEYRRIFLIGHSLGGIVLRGVAALYAERPQRKMQRRLAGLVTIATPLFGHSGVPWIAGLLSRDFRTLGLNNRYLSKTRSLLDRHYRPEEYRNPADRKNLPQWAIWAAEENVLDRWTRRHTDEAGLPADQTLTVPGSHTEAAKPASKESEVYRLVAGAIQKVCKVRRGHRESTAIYGYAETVDHLRSVDALATSLLGEVVGTFDLSPEALEACAHVYWLVWEEDSAAEDNRGPLVGYYSAIPLTDEAVGLVKSGKLLGSNLGIEHLTPTLAEANSVYIGAIVAKTWLARRDVIGGLVSKMHSLARGRSIELLTRPATDDGLRLAVKRGFKPFAPEKSGLHQLYQLSLGPGPEPA